MRPVDYRSKKSSTADPQRFHGKNQITGIGKLKYDAIRQSSVLSYECDTSQLSQIGGFKNLKTWLQKRQMIFVGDKTVPGLDVPKGILLLGVQGCGKSLAAKLLQAHGNPLLRLDVARCSINISANRTKDQDSLKMAERMSPCVLWIDEIEKGISPEDDMMEDYRSAYWALC